MPLSDAQHAELRRLVQELRLKNILTVVQLMNKDIPFQDEGELRKQMEAASLTIEWCHKLIQQSIK
jgi:hypothetical protein